MKTSQSDLELIERYLDNRLDVTDASGFLVRLQSDADFRRDVAAQTTVRDLVRRHHFSRLKQQARELHNRLYHDPFRRSLRLAIESIFKH
jgi:hypothetical protein